jgi:hypothetical protein
MDTKTGAKVDLTGARHFPLEELQDHDLVVPQRSGRRLAAGAA